MRPPCLTIVALILAALLATACPPGDRNVVRREGRPDVYLVDSTDPGMHAAIDSAQSSVSYLIARLQAPPPSQTDLAVKVRVAEGTTVEHIWVTDVTYDSGVLRGVVNNDPVYLRHLKLGDSLRFRTAELSDWMAVDHGKLVAGYTLRLLRARMGPRERARLDSSLNFTIQP